MTEFDHAGVRLKTSRMASGFKSAREFCEKNTIPTSTYSLHETGRRNIKPKTAKKYADLLGVNVVWLLTGSGSPYDPPMPAKENPLSHHEFMALLSHQGNKPLPLPASDANAVLHSINPHLFCNIVVRMVETLGQAGIHLALEVLTQKAVETYQDIVSSSDDPTAQLTMVDLATTTFKRYVEGLKESLPNAANQ